MKSYLSRFIEDSQTSSVQGGSSINPNYMNVIRESPRLRERRQKLRDKRDLLMRMEFDSQNAGRQRNEMISFIN